MQAQASLCQWKEIDQEAAAFAADLLARPREAVVDCQNFPYLSCFSTCLSSRLSPRFLSRLSRWEKGNGLAPQRLFITWHEVWGSTGMITWEGGGGGQDHRKGCCPADRLQYSSIEENEEGFRGLGAKGVQLLPNGIDWQRIDEISLSRGIGYNLCWKAGRP